MAIKADLAIIAGNDIFAHLVLNRFVPALRAAGLTPALFLPRNPKPKCKKRRELAGQREIVAGGYAEREIWSDVVYPFLAENEGTPTQIAFSPGQLAARYGFHCEPVDGSPNSPAFRAKFEAVEGTRWGRFRCGQCGSSRR